MMKTSPPMWPRGFPLHCRGWLIVVLAGVAAQLAAEPVRIAGRVVDAVSQAGLESAEVRLLRGEEVLAETESGTHGRFELIAPGPGVYRLRAELPGYVDPFFRRGDATLIRAGSGGLGRATLYLTRGAAMAGTVAGAAGEAVRGARVVAMLRRGREAAPKFVAVGAAAFTDDRGRYRLHGLPPGVYGAVVAPDGAQTGAAIFAPVYSGGVSDARQAQFFRLSAGETRDGVDFLLPRRAAGAVSGTLSQLPGEWRDGEAVVAAFPSSNADSPLALTRAGRGGAFRFPDLPPGTYRVVAMGPVIGWSGDGPVFSSPFRRAEQTVEVREGEAASAAIEISDGFEVNGVVSFSGGTSSAACSGDLQILLRALGETLAAEPLKARVSRGAFRLGGVQPGRYQVETAGAAPPCSLGEVRAGDQLLSDRVLDVRGPAAVSVLLSSDSGAIVGTTVQVQGEEAPTRFALLLPWAPSSALEDGAMAAEIDAGGHFRFEEVPPGTYRLFALRQLDAAVLDAEAVVGVPSVRVEVEGGETVSVKIKVRP